MRTKKLNKTRAFVKAFIHKNKQNYGDKVSGFVKIAKIGDNSNDCSQGINCERAV
jgi:hypothetical protein